MTQTLKEKMDNSEQNLVFPPQTLNNFNDQISKKYPDIIDYDKHPAYVNLIKLANLKDKIRSIAIFTKFFFIVSVKRLISYELIPAHLRKPKSISSFIVFFKKILLNNYFKLLYKKDIPVEQTGKQIFEKLDEQGICVVDINQNQFDKIEKFAFPLIENLRAFRNQKTKKSREFTESRTTLLRPNNTDLFHAVESSFTESGILEAIAKYLGRPVKVIDINPQINDKSDDFWRHFFSDLVMEPNSTAYCHRDASGGDVKVIIYLSDVKIDNGPFSFIIGSHKSKPNWVDNRVQEVNDTSGFSATDLKARQFFSALPAFLRKKCAFGNDLKTDSEAAKKISAAEWKITADKGHAVIFDSKGIHRGGMVLNDERLVITCIVG